MIPHNILAPKAWYKVTKRQRRKHMQQQLNFPGVNGSQAQSRAPWAS
jgi:hypothetical protein